MKKFSCVFLAFAVFISSTLTAFAVPLEGSYVKDGDTYLGIFKTSMLDFEEEKMVLREWLSSDSNLLFSRTDQNGDFVYYFVDVVNPDSVKVTDMNPGCFIELEGYTILTFRAESDGTKSFLYMTGSSGVLSYGNVTLISGSVFDGGYPFPGNSDGYLADYVGKLYLVDDSGMFEGEPEPPPEEDNFFEGILNWLLNFWENLKNFFIGLFVPSPDYFQNFFDEISNAVSAKLNGITSLYTILKNFFAGLGSGVSSGTPSFIWNIRAGAMYEGSPAHSVDIFRYAIPYIVFIKGILTAIVVLYSGVVCYRKIVTVFNS